MPSRAEGITGNQAKLERSEQMSAKIISQDRKWTYRDALRERNRLARSYPRGWFKDRLLVVLPQPGGNWAIAETSVGH
jgi:hypothetical protein